MAEFEQTREQLKGVADLARSHAEDRGRELGPVITRSREFGLGQDVGFLYGVRAAYLQLIGEGAIGGIVEKLFDEQQQIATDRINRLKGLAVEQFEKRHGTELGPREG